MGMTPYHKAKSPSRHTEPAIRGQKIMTDTWPDRSSYKEDNTAALMGNEMGGGPLDLSHSIASEKDDGSANFMKDAPKPRPVGGVK